MQGSRRHLGAVVPGRRPGWPRPNSTAASGIGGRPCELLLVDASAESPDVERSLHELVDHGEVDALVGMCISSVRHRIVGAVGGRVPFVYPCLYEGGETTPNVYAIGETSARQLQPSIAWLSSRGLARRWMLIGHDYIWPRVSHRIARERIADLGGEVVAEAVMPWGCDDYGAVFDQLRKSRVDALLISMVGQEAVEFNRAFGRAGLSRQVLRLSCAIEENQLLAIGAAYTENLHVALGYFASLETEANLAFRQRYQSRFGERAPTLNAIGQSLYEGMHFLAAMLHPDTDGAQSPLAYCSARGATLLPSGETAGADLPGARRGPRLQGAGAVLSPFRDRRVPGRAPAAGHTRLDDGGLRRPATVG